jgi:glutamate--cysteine ligase
MVARRGREPNLELWRDGRSIPMRIWASELLDEMAGVCEVLDRGDAGRPYALALAAQAAKVANIDLTPSARLMREMGDTGESFFELALRMSKLHKQYFLDLYTPNEARLREFGAAAALSLTRQRELEASDRVSFDEYLARYVAQ